MGAAAPAANAAAWAKCFASAAAKEDTPELKALARVLAALPAHERGGNVVSLLRRSLKELDFGFALGAWRLLHKVDGNTGTLKLESPLNRQELDALLATLPRASYALREVLLEVVEESRALPSFPRLASLWTCPPWPATELRMHLIARRGKRSHRWREAKETAYFQHAQLPLVDPRPASMRGLHLRHLQELLQRHATYLQEPAFDEQSQCYLRPTCWDFYAKVLKAVSIEGRSFVELYLPQEVDWVVSHCWLQPFEDLVLGMERHALHCQSALIFTNAPQKPGSLGNRSYWLSLLCCLHMAAPSWSQFQAEHHLLLAAMESSKNLLIVWDTAGRWSTRLWCLYELLVAEDLRAEIRVASLEGILGTAALANSSRRVARRMVASDPRNARARLEELEYLKRIHGEDGYHAMEGALLAAAVPLLCLGSIGSPPIQSGNFWYAVDVLAAQLCHVPCLLIEAPSFGHRRGQVARAVAERLRTRTTQVDAILPVQIPCGFLADLMEAKQSTGSDDLLQLWFQSLPGEGLAELELAVAKFTKLLILLEGLEEAGRHSSSIITWARGCLTSRRDVIMIVTTSGEGERLLPEKMAKMDVLTCDLLHLSLPETAVPVATIMATLKPALRIRIKIAGTKDLQLDCLPNGDPVCLGHHEYLDLAEDEESQMNCFEVFEKLVSKFQPFERQLSELALQVCSAGAPHVVPIPKTLRQRCSEMLELHGGRGGFGHLLSFYCAKALHRRNDMMPQVLSNQWPQVRHFLRRALEQEFRQMGDADVPKELQVLQQKFKMARQLGADAATVLAPQLITSPSTSAVAVEALNAWLATALEAGEAQLPQLLSLGSSAARASPDILDAAVLAAARARVRLQELQRYEDVSIHEILVTVEAAASAAPEMKWPLAGRFMEKMKGRICGLNELKLLIRLALAAEVSPSMLQEPIQEFLDASLPCQLEVASSLLMADRFAAARAACEDRLQRWRHGTWPQRRLSGGRYHSLLLQGGRTVAVGLNGQGESSVPCLGRSLRYVAVAAGVQHTLLLCSDGAVKACGLNLDGQCAMPETGSLQQPIVAISAGGFHSVLLDDAGQALALGCNDHGQCNLPAGFFVSVQCGRCHTLCLRADGWVEACGANEHGQCDVPDLFRDSSSTYQLKYISGAAGGQHSVLLRNDGKAVAFGWNLHGQCDVPQDHHYVAAACGENHTVLLCKDRTVLAVGDDRHGQCQVPGLPPDLHYVAVAAGDRHTLLLRSDGRVMAFGDDGEGQCQIPNGLLLDDS